MSTVLIVDDEPAICWALERALAQEGHEVCTAATAEEGLATAHKVIPDVVLLDVRLPGLDGLSALEQLRDAGTPPRVIVMTAFGDLDTAVRAIHQGAFDYLTKPFDLDQAVELVRRAAAESEGDEDRSKPAVAERMDGMLLGRSPAMQEVFRKIALAAEREVPILISGESGTGKELVATAIHRYSRRSGGPFLPICLPALSEPLVESELFGHVRGAFTGAHGDRMGLLRAAHAGTAFLDEIGDVSLLTQAKLLRVLETKMVTPVGSNDPQPSDFRLLAATNRSLDEMVAEGTFREDLFYRLNVFRIHLPPLRERREDVDLLAKHFLARSDSERHCEFSADALEELRTRPWYGNVRELRHAVEHASIVARSGRIRADSLPPPLSRRSSREGQADTLDSAVQQWLRSLPAEGRGSADAPGLYDRFLQEAEPALLKDALARSGGNRSEAARLLGIHRQTLRDKLRRHGLDSLDLAAKGWAD